jgi:hypothetical protein
MVGPIASNLSPFGYVMEAVVHLYEADTGDEYKRGRERLRLAAIKWLGAGKRQKRRARGGG